MILTNLLPVCFGGGRDTLEFLITITSSLLRNSSSHNPHLIHLSSHLIASIPFYSIHSQSLLHSLYLSLTTNLFNQSNKLINQLETLRNLIVVTDGYFFRNLTISMASIASWQLIWWQNKMDGLLVWLSVFVCVCDSQSIFL